MCVSAEQKFTVGVNYTAYVLSWDTADPGAIRTGKGRILWELKRKVGADMQLICFIQECEPVL